MDQINGLAAESAEGATQSAEACAQLSQLALSLQALVARFEIGRPESNHERVASRRRKYVPLQRSLAAAAGTTSHN